MSGYRHLGTRKSGAHQCHELADRAALIDFRRFPALIHAIRNPLVQREPLSARHRDHPLRGIWKGYREAHIEPDWLVIHQVKGGELHLVRTGAHSDLFKEGGSGSVPATRLASTAFGTEPTSCTSGSEGLFTGIRDSSRSTLTPKTTSLP